MSEKNQLTLGSLFDGIGGFPYAASFYGIRPLWASEIVPECVAVTKRHFPDMAHLGDITQLHGGMIPPVDILTFGSPCQGLSLAGRRLGLADERSGLFTEAIRIIREMQEATHGRYPQFAIFENVPGALSSNGRRDYQAVLEAFTGAKVPMPRSGRWANAGMARGRGVDLAWIVYDAQYFGTAQRRRRLFLVCDFRGKRSAEILFVPKSLRRYFEAGGTPRQGLAAFTSTGADTAGGAVEVLNDQGGDSITVERTGVSPTLRSQTHGNLPVVAVGFDAQQITSKTNRSALKPVQPTLCGTGSPHVIIRPVCMATGQANAATLDDQAPTLTAAHERPLLVHPRLAGTLCASGAGLSRPAGMGSELDFCVTSAGFRYKAGSAAGSVGYQTETAPTLIAEQPSGVLQAYSISAYYSGGMLSDNPAVGFREAGISRTLDQNGGNPGCQQGGIAVVDIDLSKWELIVRRLTPLEAERLMGFEDHWTEYGYDGKPISDTKRYSMLGNSIAVPCVAYIMQGITDVLGRGGVL